MGIIQLFSFDVTTRAQILRPIHEYQGDYTNNKTICLEHKTNIALLLALKCLD